MSKRRPLAQQLELNTSIAFNAIIQNKLRALLTSLGIIFGVASVISMLSIGEGARVEILEQMRLLGVNNIVIEPTREKVEGQISADDDKRKEQQKYSPGLTIADAENIEAVVPGVEFSSPEVIIETTVIRKGFKRSGRLVGIGEHYFRTIPFDLYKGRWFSPRDLDSALPVAIIGYAVASRFFPNEDPIGRQIKCGRLWLTVVGVLKSRSISESDISRLGIRDYNMDIYTPVNTALLRMGNRARITPEDIRQQRSRRNGEDEAAVTDVNYHQLDRLVIRVESSDEIASIADIISRILERRHNGKVDYEVSVPELLLKQEQRTKQIFNFVLGAIASISLIVGGIGIMNIMLASVLERIKEIGIRQALGATRKDILQQFLFEALAISVSGGATGILLGIGLASAIEGLSGIRTVIQPEAVFISLFVAMGTGLVFGIFPARNAAKKDPIESLRYE